jgi:nucleoside phosphorylase
VTPIDFIIVTALPEERDAVLSKLPGYKKLPPSDEDVRVYYWCELNIAFPDDSNGVYQIVVLPLPGMGRVKASNATKDAIHRWKPRHVLLVGIAGGMSKNGAALGDVLVSEQIVDYELQKNYDDREEPRYEVHRAHAGLLARAQNCVEDWVNLIQTKRPKKGKPQALFGPIATGDKVDARGDFLAKHGRSWPKVIGIEMESGGVASASFDSAKPPGFFMVRSVSDLADGDKDSRRVTSWRSYACDVAASYAISLLKSGPVPIKKRGSRKPGTTRDSSAKVGRPPRPASNLLQNWDLFEPELQDALALAYNQSLREGSRTIQTRYLFAAMIKLNPKPLNRLFKILPPESLPSAIKVRNTSKKRVLEDKVNFSACVIDSLQHMSPRATPRRKLSSEDVFVDIAKHGHGTSVARMRQHGVSARKIDQYVKQLHWQVLKRDRSS